MNCKFKNLCFSEAFIENIRRIAIKHVQVFNRRLPIFLKNSSYKDVIYLYIFNFITVLTLCKNVDIQLSHTRRAKILRDCL
jgi:hypothetical protein